MSFRNPFAALAVDDDLAATTFTPSTPPAQIRVQGAQPSTPIRRMPYGWRPAAVLTAPPPPPLIVEAAFPALGQQARIPQMPTVGAWGKGIETVRKAASLPPPVCRSQPAKAAAKTAQAVFFSDDECTDEDEDEEAWD